MVRDDDEREGKVLYVIGSESAVIVLELENIDRLIKGKPIVTTDKMYCLAVVKDIDSFVDAIEASDIADADPKERPRMLVKLIEQFCDCEQVDSRAFTEGGSARVSVATLGNRRVIIMEMQVIDALLSYYTVTHPGMGAEIMVSKNLPFVKEKIETFKSHTIDELRAAVAESNKQQYAPLQMESGTTEITHIRRENPEDPPADPELN